MPPAPIDQAAFEAGIYDWVAAALKLEAWAPATTYAVGDRRRNGGNVYEVTVAGLSAPAGPGPAGVGAVIVDNLATWKWLHAGDHMPVIWGTQDADAPTSDFVQLSITSVVQVHQEAEENLFDAGRPLGEEVEQRVSKDYEIGLTIELVTDADTGQNTARGVGRRMMTRLSLPTVRAMAKAAGISVLDLGRMIIAPKVYGPDFEGRGILDVRLLVRDTASDFTGYIAVVETVDQTTS